MTPKPCPSRAHPPPSASPLPTARSPTAGSCLTGPRSTRPGGPRAEEPAGGCRLTGRRGRPGSLRPRASNRRGPCKPDDLGMRLFGCGVRSDWSFAPGLQIPRKTWSAVFRGAGATTDAAGGASCRAHDQRGWRMADSWIATVLAADDRFSRPLAATVRSVVSQLTPGRGLDLYLCDMGITAPNRDKIATAAAHPDVRLHWVTTLGGEVEHLPEAVPGISRAAYARLFIPRVLPPGMDRALYLDCDLIVRRCVGGLFDSPMGDFAALGVADAGSPYVSSLYGVPYWSRYGRRP